MRTFKATARPPRRSMRSTAPTLRGRLATQVRLDEAEPVQERRRPEAKRGRDSRAPGLRARGRRAAPPSRSATVGAECLVPPQLACIQDQVEHVVGGQLVGFRAVPIDDAGHRARLVDEDVGRPVVAVDPAGGQARACRPIAGPHRSRGAPRPAYEPEVLAGLPAVATTGASPAAAATRRSTQRDRRSASAWSAAPSEAVRRCKLTDGLECRGRGMARPTRHRRAPGASVVGRSGRSRRRTARPRLPVGAHRRECARHEPRASMPAIARCASAARRRLA